MRLASGAGGAATAKNQCLPATMQDKGGNAARRGLAELDGNSVAISMCFLRLGEEFAHLPPDQTLSKRFLSADGRLSIIAQLQANLRLGGGASRAALAKS